MTVKSNTPATPKATTPKKRRTRKTSTTAAKKPPVAKVTTTTFKSGKVISKKSEFTRPSTARLITWERYQKDILTRWQIHQYEVQELVNLQLFYSAVYLPLRKLLKKADEDGNKDASKSLRADMKAAASKPESLLESPPASVAPFVSKYLQGIVMSGSKPEPKRRDYKGDLEAFKSASEKYTATQGQREGRLRQLVPTYEKAYELLKQDYEDRGGTRHQRRSGKPRKESFRRRNKKLKKIYRG